MQSLTGQLASFDEGASVLLVIIGLVYGLFGWRLIRWLVVVDALALAAICAAWAAKRGTLPYLDVPSMPSSLILVLVLPLLAWRFPAKANVGMAGLAGFVCMQLFLMDIELPFLAMAVVSAVGAAFAMALAATLARQTTVVVTGLHGGWLCVAALSILTMNSDNAIGGMLKSFTASFSLVTPLAAVAFSAILIFLQWSDMQGHTSQS